MDHRQFDSCSVTKRITRIEDPLGVFIYLIEGAEQALLVDTGFGVGDLGGYVRSVTSKPINVVLTHGHVDHAFGAAAFESVYLHPDDAEVMRSHAIPALESQATAVAEGRQVQPLPDAATFRALKVGSCFDLGGLSVEVHEGRGHTPGSVTLLVVEERILITGDAASQGTFLFLPESSTVSDYRTMLRRLAHRLEGRYDRVLVSHLSGEMPATLLADLITLCDSVLRRTDDAQPFEFMGMHGLAARKVDFSRPVPSAANIVYNPGRLGLLGRTDTESRTGADNAAPVKELHAMAASKPRTSWS